MPTLNDLVAAEADLKRLESALAAKEAELKALDKSHTALALAAGQGD